MRPNLSELRRVLVDVRAATRADRGLDAATLLALGWEVRRGAEARRPQAWRMRAPLARLWQPVPLLSREPFAAFVFLPIGWEVAVGRNRARPGWANVNNGEPYGLGVGGVAPNPRRLAFEVTAPTPGLAALTVTIMALIALQEGASAPAAPDAPHQEAA